MPGAKKTIVSQNSFLFTNIITFKCDTTTPKLFWLVIRLKISLICSDYFRAQSFSLQHLFEVSKEQIVVGGSNWQVWWARKNEDQGFHRLYAIQLTADSTPDWNGGYMFRPLSHTDEKIPFNASKQWQTAPWIVNSLLLLFQCEQMRHLFRKGIFRGEYTSSWYV